MSVFVKIPTTLRPFTQGEKTVEVAVDVETVDDTITALDGLHPGLKGKLLNEEGQLHRYINIFVGNEIEGGDDIRYLGGLATAVTTNSYVTILPAVAGG